MNCRICESKCEVVDNSIKLRKDTLKFLPSKHPSSYVESIFFKCNNCGHFQIDYMLEEAYYEDSYSFESGVKQYEQSHNFTEERIQKLSSMCDCESIFEIGSGSGFALKIARQCFKNHIGIESSKNLYTETIKQGLTVINSYFDEKVSIGHNYSAFMCFMVFEHLENPNMILKEAFNRLKPGGVGLINVPNGRQIVNNKLFHQLVLEHINYFTIESLVKLAQQNGFIIEDVIVNTDLIEITLYVSKQKVSTNFTETTLTMCSCLQKKIFIYDNIALWGSGARCSHYYNLLPSNIKVSHFFDSNVEKKGKFASGIPYVIEAPTLEILNSISVILILASGYNRQIIELLRTKFNFTGVIIYFENDRILENTH